MKSKIPSISVLPLAALFMTIPMHVTTAGDLDRAIELVVQMNEAAAQSQRKVEVASDEQSDLLNQFRNVEQQIASIELYNKQIGDLVAAQDAQATELQSRIDKAVLIGRQVTPLMIRMIDSLETFVSLDLPFLMEERTGRVKRLREMMDRPDVTEAEKFRRILEAYQIENEFGRTIESFRGPLAIEGREPRTVEYLRVGRVALLYITLDGEEMGAFNQDERQWQPLPGEYKSSIQAGLRIARKQSAPDLFRVPVLAPRKAK